MLDLIFLIAFICTVIPVIFLLVFIYVTIGKISRPDRERRQEERKT